MNPLPTEAVLAILMGVTMVFLLLHATVRTRTSAWAAITFLMATQVHNTIYHLGGSVLFSDISLGLIMALA